MRPRPQILVAATLGALTTVAIAWAASLQSMPGMISSPMVWRHRDPAKGEGTGWLRTDISQKPGWRSTLTQATSPRTYSFDNQTDQTPEQVVNPLARSITMPWLDGRRQWPNDHEIETIALNEYGWPFKSLYSVWSFNSGKFTWASCLEVPIPWFKRRALAEMPGLPIGVAWGRFTANTLLWTPLWWMVFRIPPATRRWLRARRKQCLSCGYELAGITGDVCPECGAPLPGSTHPEKVR